MKKMLSQITVFVFAMAMLVGNVFAAEQSSLYLDGYRAWLTPQSGGRIAVSIDVQAVDYMDEVGALRVEIWESDDGGNSWNNVRTYYSANHPEMLTQDDYWYYDTPVTYEGTAGYKYFAVVEVYAGDSTGWDSRDYQTYSVTARN